MDARAQAIRQQIADALAQKFLMEIKGAPPRAYYGFTDENNAPSVFRDPEYAAMAFRRAYEPDGGSLTSWSTKADIPQPLWANTSTEEGYRELLNALQAYDPRSNPHPDLYSRLTSQASPPQLTASYPAPF